MSKPWLEVLPKKSSLKDSAGPFPRTLVGFPCGCGSRAGTKEGCTSSGWMRCYEKLLAWHEWRDHWKVKLASQSVVEDDRSPLALSRRWESE